MYWSKCPSQGQNGHFAPSCLIQILMLNVTLSIGVYKFVATLPICRSHQTHLGIIDHKYSPMKKSGIVAATTVAAVSAAVVRVSSSSSSSSTVSLNTKHQQSHKDGDSSEERDYSSSQDKFAPRFDGLRFIETLITAHR
ncbi:hypothetical protein Droror1_Dr00003113 [Drosera rotundifolia]